MQISYLAFVLPCFVLELFRYVNRIVDVKLKIISLFCHIELGRGRKGVSAKREKIKQRRRRREERNNKE